MRNPSPFARLPRRAKENRLAAVFSSHADVDGLSVGARRVLEIGDDGVEVLVFLPRAASARLLDLAADKRFGEVVAARFPAGAAIDARKHFGDRVDAGVFFHVEDHGEQDEQDREDDREAAEKQDSVQDVHGYSFLSEVVSSFEASSSSFFCCIRISA